MSYSTWFITTQRQERIVIYRNCIVIVLTRLLEEKEENAQIKNICGAIMCEDES
jgi:hypothetical protein